MNSKLKRSSFHLTWVLFVLINSAASEGLRAVRLNVSLPDGRKYMSTSFDGVDSIYLFGGHRKSGYIDDILKYSISSEQIEVVAKFPDPIYAGTVARGVGGEMFYMGGYRLGSRSSSDIFKFSPSTGRVEKSNTALPKPNKDSCAVSWNNLVYIFGGSKDPTGIVQFDMDSLKTSRVGSLPQISIAASCFSDNAGSAFLFRGSHPAIKINLSTLEVEYGQRPLPGTSFSSAVWDGDLFAYIIGGTYASKRPTDSIIKFNRVTMEDVSIDVENFHPDATQFYYSMSSVYVPSRDGIYVFGGAVDGAYQNGIWYIELSSNVKPNAVFFSNTSGVGSVICGNKTADILWLGSSEEYALEVYINNATQPSLSQTSTKNKTLSLDKPYAHYKFKLKSRDNCVFLGNCSTEAETPYKNPTDVKASFPKPDLLHIIWSPVSSIDQNGNGFGYSVKWKMEQEEEWSEQLVSGFQQSYVMIENGGKAPFPSGEYLVTVTSFNEKGLSTYLPELVKIHKELGVEQENSIGSSSISTWMYVVIFTLMSIIAISSFLFYRLRRIFRSQEKLIRPLTINEINAFKCGNPDYSLEVLSVKIDHDVIAAQTLSYDETFEIPFNKIHIDYANVLGVGAFGMVFKGKLTQNHDGSEMLPVAVKTVKRDVEVEYFKALLSEIKIMGHIGSHENVVGFVGACTEEIIDRKVFIVVEFCKGGSLDSFLKNNENRTNFKNLVEHGKFKRKRGFEPYNLSFSSLNLFQWALNISKGLQYIHQKHVIHADLAIRNILLSENLTAKVSDFGLSKKLVDASNYIKKSQAPLPWRHLSPEVLQQKNFSYKSDIWALGVVFWEIFELGHIPYGGSTWSIDFVRRIISGERLPQPKNATNSLYDLMLKCWELEPKDRATVESSIQILQHSICEICELNYECLS